MKYNLCSACIYFQPRLLTEERATPKSCLRDEYRDIFGPDSGGFPSGIDIIHCDYFVQNDAFFGDVAIRDEFGRMVSYVLTQARNFKLIRCPRLYDNKQNIKIHDIQTNKRPRDFEESPF